MRLRRGYMRAVVLFTASVLLAGVLGTPLPTAAVTPGEAGKDICRVVTFGLCWIYFPEELSVNPAPPQPIKCTQARFVGPPGFLTKPIMTVKYQFHGSCSRADLPNAPALNYRVEGSWTPGERDPNKPNASESLTMTGYEPYLPNRAPGGRIFMYWTARCEGEPWLSPDGVPEGKNCRDRRFYLPDDLVDKFIDLIPLWTFPRSRDAIPQHDRPQLYARYLQLTSPATTSANPLVKKQPSSVQQTTPVPSSAVTAPSPILQTAPLPPSAVAAPPSTAPSPMRRSPSMIRPRGVEGETGTPREENSATVTKP